MATPHFLTQYKCSSFFTHNLTMNQDSADLAAYKFQHLPSFYLEKVWHCFIWPAHALTFYTQPKQKLAQDSCAFPRTLTQMQTAVLSCNPLAPLFYSAGSGLSVAGERGPILTIQGADPAVDVWVGRGGGGGGGGSITLPLPTSPSASVSGHTTSFSFRIISFPLTG